MSGKSGLAAVLVACYAGACVGSLWDRTDSIISFALVSAATLYFIFPPMAERVVIGLILGVVATALGIGVPGVGDAIDGLGLLVAFVVAFARLALRTQKWVNFAIRIPLGAACFGFYAILWWAAKSLPASYSMTGVHHSFWFYLIAVLIAAVVGIIAPLVVAGIYSLGNISPSNSLIYSLGYPWYLILFLLILPFGGDNESMFES
jgi:hypothetical protein